MKWTNCPPTDSRCGQTASLDCVIPGTDQRRMDLPAGSARDTMQPWQRMVIAAGRVVDEVDDRILGITIMPDWMSYLDKTVPMLRHQHYRTMTMIMMRMRRVDGSCPLQFVRGNFTDNWRWWSNKTWATSGSLLLSRRVRCDGQKMDIENGWT